MGSKDRHYTSSGSKSRDTRGAEPSQDDVKQELQDAVPGGGADRQTGKIGAPAREKTMESLKQTRH